MVDMVDLAGDAVAGTGPGQQDRDVVFSGHHQRVAGHSGGPVQYKLRHTLQLYVMVSTHAHCKLLLPAPFPAASSGWAPQSLEFRTQTRGTPPYQTLNWICYKTTTCSLDGTETECKHSISINILGKVSQLELGSEVRFP